MFVKDKVCRETILEKMFGAGLTNRGVILLLTSHSEKNVPSRIRIDYSFSNLSCIPTSSKALECRGDIKAMFRCREDSQCEGNDDICLAARLMGSGNRLKVSLGGYSCIKAMPVVSDVNDTECILLGLVVVIAMCQSQSSSIIAVTQ